MLGLAACSSTSDSESNNTAPTHPVNATEPAEESTEEPLATIPALTGGVDSYADRARVEAEMARTIGATHAVWLPRGLTRDYEDFGTSGHVDIVATFASPGVVLLHWQGDPAHPDHEVSVELEGLLSGARDARGEPLEVVRLPGDHYSLLSAPIVDDLALQLNARAAAASGSLVLS